MLKEEAQPTSASDLSQFNSQKLNIVCEPSMSPADIPTCTLDFMFDRYRLRADTTEFILTYSAHTFEASLDFQLLKSLSIYTQMSLSHYVEKLKDDGLEIM